MALVNLESIYDLVGSPGVAGSGPVGDMANQTGPPWNIIGPDITKGLYPFNIPAGSQLHAGPLENQAGRSLVGPDYSYNYGGAYPNASGLALAALLDLNGIIPYATHPSITINPLGSQQLPYNQFGPPDGFY